MHGIVTRKRFRTIWISDVYLGSRDCKADYRLDFLQSTESETFYLVGDIVDGWQLRRSWYWPRNHDQVVQTLLKIARKVTRVNYVPGNHNEVLRRYIGVHFADVKVRQDAVHTTADARRLLVLHGGPI